MEDPVVPSRFRRLVVVAFSVGSASAAVAGAQTEPATVDALVVHSSHLCRPEKTTCPDAADSLLIIYGDVSRRDGKPLGEVSAHVKFGDGWSTGGGWSAAEGSRMTYQIPVCRAWPDGSTIKWDLTLYGASGESARFSGSGTRSLGADCPSFREE